jgi:hypothetical protein
MIRNLKHQKQNNYIPQEGFWTNVRNQLIFIKRKQADADKNSL